MEPRLTNDVEKAVEDKHGCTRLEGDAGSYIVMSMDAYRTMMGVGSDEELDESLRAIDEGLADIKAGRHRDYKDVLADLE